MARNATPVRVQRKAAVTAATAAAATTPATSLSMDTKRPPTSSTRWGKGRGTPPGIPRKSSAAPPRMSAPRPSVTMMSETTGRPTRRRSTSRLKSTANPIIPTQAASSAPGSPSANR